MFTLFKKKLQPISSAPYKAQQLKDTIHRNRQALDAVDNWIDNTAFSNSFFNYGVPDFIKNDINKKIDNETTYTDLIVKIADENFLQLNYLEIGVSVGKNFYQVINSCENGTFTGFDIEEINPVLERHFQLNSKTEWETKPSSIKKNKSSVRQYSFKDKLVNYISGDVWDVNSWSRLKGNKFNIIFSDALHTPEAILFEFEMLVKNDLLAEKFVIVWDDLVGAMQNSFYKIIRKYDKTFNIKEVYLFNVNGWIGQYESPHTAGIISNFKLQG